MHLNSILLFKKHAFQIFRDDMKVLEVGAAGYPSKYAQLVNNKTIEWTTLDIGDSYNSGSKNNPLHITSLSEYKYPIADNSFDIVLSCQVIEHVKKIWDWMDELQRVTKPGGKVIIINPVSWIFHEAPVDCWRMYPDGMVALMENSGLQVEKSICESLEEDYLPGYFPTLPGVSTIPPSGAISKALRIKGFYNQLIRHIPVIRSLVVPVTVAHDTISIATKAVK